MLAIELENQIITQKKTIICFIIQKYANIGSSLTGLTNLNNMFIKEKLTPRNNKLVFHCRKLKQDCHIEKNIHKKWCSVYSTWESVQDFTYNNVI